MSKPRTDSERLDWLENKTVGYGGWIARMSVHGRGYRLHETTQPGHRPTAREAIDAAMDAEESEG